MNREGGWSIARVLAAAGIALAAALASLAGLARHAHARGDDAPPAPSWWVDDYRPSSRRGWDLAGGLPGPDDPPPVLVLTGQPHVDADDALEDARAELRRVVKRWLDNDVSEDWDAPETLLASLVRDEHVQRIDNIEGNPVADEFPHLYKAGYRVELSPEIRARLLDTHRDEVARRKLALAGGGIAFLVACLGALAGYLKADDATRGYYSTPLRLIFLAITGAVGASLYTVLF